MITLAEYTVNQILPYIGSSKISLETNEGSFRVRADSIRLECFKKNISCVECKVVGNVFLLQTTIDNSPKVKLNCFIKDCHICGMYRRLQVQRCKDDMIGPKTYHTPHLNLFSRQPNGKMILMTKDHIMPKSRGGADNIHNIQTMCEHCNCRKGSLHPDEYQRMLEDRQRLAG